MQIEKGTPIILNKNAVAVIHIFKREDSLSDIWLFDSDEIQAQVRNDWELAAKSFVEQLEQNWSISFMKALKKEINNILDSNDKDILTRAIHDVIRDNHNAGLLPRDLIDNIKDYTPTQIRNRMQEMIDSGELLVDAERRLRLPESGDKRAD